MHRFLVLFCFYFFISCSSQKQSDLILTDVSIVDIENGEIILNQLVAISGDKILATDDASNLGNYHSERIIGLDGKFVMPGLWDNHIHFRGGEELVESNKNLLPLLLALSLIHI